MTRRPPCSRFCPLITACQECDWQSLWSCQVCQGPAHEGEVICKTCGWGKSAGQTNGEVNHINSISNNILVHCDGAGPEMGRPPVASTNRGPDHPAHLTGTSRRQA